MEPLNNNRMEPWSTLWTRGRRHKRTVLLRTLGLVAVASLAFTQQERRFLLATVERKEELVFSAARGGVTNETLLVSDLEQSVTAAEVAAFKNPTEDVNNSSTRSRTRWSFVLHIGPPKTATTSLQRDLTLMQDVLHQDNTLFDGKYYYDDRRTEKGPDRGPVLEALFRLECQAQIYPYYQNNSDNNVTVSELPACWQSFRQTLQVLQGQHLIVSEEALSFRKIRMDHGVYASVAWKALYETLDEFGWDLQVVTGYRRLYERLPSGKQQKDRYVASKSKRCKWPGTQKGRRLQPFFPDLLKQPLVVAWQKHRDRIITTPELESKDYWKDVLHQVPSFVPQHLLNLHDHSNSSVRTLFVCDILEAPKTCAASRQMDLDSTETRVNREQSLFYDVLATTAADWGWIDTATYKRRAVEVGLYHLHEEILQLQPHDLPLQCPSQADLDTLWHVSLDYEGDVMGVRYMHQHLASHREGFDRAIESHKLCWVNATAALLDQSVYRDYIQEHFGYGEQKESAL